MYNLYKIGQQYYFQINLILLHHHLFLSLLFLFFFFLFFSFYFLFLHLFFSCSCSCSCSSSSVSRHYGTLSTLLVGDRGETGQTIILKKCNILSCGIRDSVWPRPPVGRRVWLEATTVYGDLMKAWRLL